MATEIIEFIERPVKLMRLVKKLDFSEENIHQAAAEQPKLYLEAARYRVQQMRKRSQAENSLEVTSAKIGIRLRKAKDSTGRKKLTEAAIKERIIRKTLVRQLKHNLDTATALEKMAEYLVDVFRQRRDAIKIITEMRLAEGLGEMRMAREEGVRKKVRKLQRDARDRINETHRHHWDGDNV